MKSFARWSVEHRVTVNLLMAVATFMLGYHYFVDSAAGVLLAAVVLAVDGILERRCQADQSSEIFNNVSLPSCRSSQS